MKLQPDEAQVKQYDNIRQMLAKVAAVIKALEPDPESDSTDDDIDTLLNLDDKLGHIHECIHTLTNKSEKDLDAWFVLENHLKALLAERKRKLNELGYESPGDNEQAED